MKHPLSPHEKIIAGIVLGACAAFVLIFGFFGCSLYFVHDQGVAVRCERQCTDAETRRVEEVLLAFAAKYEGFDPYRRLEIRFVDVNGEWSGRTSDSSHVAITSLAVLPHELLHVHLWRRDGDPDRNHEQSGGPWTEEDNETLRAIRVALGI